MRGLYIFIICVCIASFSQAQESEPTAKRMELEKINTFNPVTDYQPQPEARFIHLEAPVPGGSSYRSFLMRQKKKSRELFPPASGSRNNKTQDNNAPEPVIENGFMKYLYRDFDETKRIAGGGNPLDNTIAVSKDGIMLSSVNSFLWGFDLNGDSTYFKDQFGNTRTIGFKQFAGPEISPGFNTFPFDPRLIYDPVHDRFIFVFIDGRTPDNSQIVIGVSSTPDPKDDWHVYAVTGNPRETNEWADFPAIAITEDDLFLTINQIEAGVSWQEGFRGSLIWQVGLDDIYNGNDYPEIMMWDNIKHNGRNIRNLLPVPPAEEPQGSNMYFLSNRNFDVQNDTLFILEITNSLKSNIAMLNTDVHILETPYGLAPNGRQENTPDGAEDSLGLQTNDARWLGGKLRGNTLHFLGNCKDFDRGSAGIYHGIIKNIDDPDNRTVSGTIISSDSLDFGYPDLAYTGTAENPDNYILTFDHTSPTYHPGVSAVYYDEQNDEYSKRITLKKGENYVHRLGGGYERWGDYIGIQRLYNDPGRVYIAGFYGAENNRTNTWLSKVSAHHAPDITGIAEQPGLKNLKNKVYPNPANDVVNIDFKVSNPTDVEAFLTNMNGQIVNELTRAELSAGKNRLILTTHELPKGVYIIVIRNRDTKELLIQERLVKSN